MVLYLVKACKGRKIIGNQFFFQLKNYEVPTLEVTLQELRKFKTTCRAS